MKARQISVPFAFLKLAMPVWVSGMAFLMGQNSRTPIQARLASERQTAQKSDVLSFTCVRNQELWPVRILNASLITAKPRLRVSNSTPGGLEVHREIQLWRLDINGMDGVFRNMSMSSVERC